MHIVEKQITWTITKNAAVEELVSNGTFRQEFQLSYSFVLHQYGMFG